MIKFIKTAFRRLRDACFVLLGKRRLSKPDRSLSHHVLVGPETEETKSLLRSVGSLDPWFYPVRIGAVQVAPGIGSNQPSQRLSDRTLFREQLIVEELCRRYDVRGKSVLELACNMGYWSSRLVERGAGAVVGVEARELFLQQADLYWDRCVDLEQDAYEFIQANVMDPDLWDRLGQEEPFEITLCMGLLYHLPDYRELVHRLAEVTRDVMVVDTRVCEAREDASAERRGLFFNAIDATMNSITPNRDRLISTLEQLGFAAETLLPRFLSPVTLPECDNYNAGNRIVIIAKRS